MFKLGNLDLLSINVSLWRALISVSCEELIFFGFTFNLNFGQCGLKKKLYMFHSKWLFLYHCSQGADYIYETYVEPFFCKHSESLDRNWVHLRNKLVATSKSLCNKALLAMQLKLTEVIHEKISTSHPVVSIIFSFKPFIMFKLGNLDLLLISVSLWGEL